MGQNLARDEIQEFLEQLAKQYTKAFDLYLLGGSAICFHGKLGFIFGQFRCNKKECNGFK